MPLPRAEAQRNRPSCWYDRARMARSNLVEAAATLEFGRFQVLLRGRKLLAGAVPIELGTRAFDLLLVLLEADGALVTKDELLSRVWPGIVVSEDNLKVQISALRKALGESRDFIRTEFGRGYRFTATVRSTTGWAAFAPSTRQRHRLRRPWNARIVAPPASMLRASSQRASK
jgi:DNA-binding winged helix-turn-helix (wHTH) protein